jgi:NAD(P)-dependent dehydrogenase (short-subunit alcohol dehydrogenase family)
VANLTRNIAMDYSPHLIHCNAICPGRKSTLEICTFNCEQTVNTNADVETAIFAETTQNMMGMDEMKKMYPFRGPGKPIDIAKMAVVLASDDASWMTGACVAVDGGYTAR